jgi:uncharacterized protein YndB with AHSA1/START domain
MDAISVIRVIPRPVAEVWRAFADPVARSGFRGVAEIEPLTDCWAGALHPGQRWRETRTTASGETITEELVVVAVDEERSCRIALAGASASGQLTYRFAPVASSTAVTLSTERQRYGFANRLLGFVLGGFAARTAEGALRSELDALAAACLAQTSV